MDNDQQRPDGDVTPQAVPRPDDPPLHIREAPTPPVYPDEPVPGHRTEPVVERPTVERTAVLPTQPAAPARAVAPLTPTIEPVYPPGPYGREERAAWPYVLALFALLAGGLGGYLIGAALDDDDDPDVVAPVGSVVGDDTDVNATLDMLLARTQADGEYRTPSEYPQLDQITEIDSAAARAPLEEQIAALSEAEGDVGELANQVATLEAALNDVTAERDELAAQLGESSDPDAQAQLDTANQQIATLEADLSAARTDLEAANAAAQQARNDLAEATAQLESLQLLVAPDYVNGDIARVRSDAAANGWTLIEEPAESPSPPGTVLEQVPGAGANMVRGSVLYVTYADNI